MLTCDQVREILWPLDRPREHSEHEETARAHLRECEACQGFFERDAVVSKLLDRHGIAAPAPGPMRERVFDALARERALFGGPRRSPRRSPRRRWTRARGLVVTAAAAALLGVSAAALWTARERGSDGVDYVHDFMSRAVEADVVESPEPDEVSRFFLRELGISVTPVTVADAKMSRAMVCLIKGRRAAMVEYEMDGTTVAHYWLPADGHLIGRGQELRTASEQGVQVARWTDERFEHALVSDLPEAELEQLARGLFTAR